MQTATKLFEQVQRSAEEIKNNQPQRFPEAASVGDFYRQGDIYVTLLEKLPAGCGMVKQPDPQLAPGTTQGSRHILDSLEGVDIYRRPTSTALQGPLLKTTTERILTHPEHGDIVLPAGVYEITYQRAYAEELRRVID